MSQPFSDPFVLIIFGGSGDLAYQHLYPALYDIAEKRLLPKDFAIVATGRRYTSEEFYEFFAHSLTSDNRHHKHSIQESFFKNLVKHIYFFPGDNTDPNFYKSLKQYLESLTKEGLTSYNRIFYVGVPHTLYSQIFENLKACGLNREGKGWTRVVVEKPLGQDLSSAKYLDKLITSAFTEDQIFRLDHYLGKETLENILALRFENNIFEPLLNANFLDHIQITASEDFDIAKRGKFYESTGALKDVGQNHILQMITLATMEEPKGKKEQDLIRERVKLISCLRANPKDLIFGQYSKGMVHGADAKAYREEESVDPSSEIDTFFALKLYIDNLRFKGVPIFIRAGKRLAEWVTEISYVFKPVHGRQNILTIRLQPNEGVSLKIYTKRPGYDLALEETQMQFCYKHFFPGQTFDAYEKLLQEVFAGKHIFFNTSKEVEALWKFIDPLSKSRSKIKFYEAGSWGPKESDDLIKESGRLWLKPQMDFCSI